MLIKVRDATLISQFRAICLCNFVHKIISKTLNNRLLSVHPSIISLEQPGFLPGRSIYESIALAHELVSDINKKIYGCNVMLKIDMSKAFDRDEAEYVFFKFNKGVRQDDPLCPRLFILTMEILSHMLYGGLHERVFNPYSSYCGSACFTHLLYADDMLVFRNGAKPCLTGLIGIIWDFCDSSGQVLNIAKSHIFLSNHISEARKQLILTETQFKEGTFPTSYLGTPLFVGRPLLPLSVSWKTKFEEGFKAG